MSCTIQPFGTLPRSEIDEFICINKFSCNNDVGAFVVNRLAKMAGNVYCEYQLDGPTGETNFFYKEAGSIEVKRIVINLSSQARHHSSIPPKFLGAKKICEIKKNIQYKCIAVNIEGQTYEEDQCIMGCNIS